MKNEYRIILASVFSLGVLATADAATWHLSKSASAGSLTPLSDMGYWGGADGVEPSSDDDLIADRDGERIRFRGIEFKGNSLRIGHNGKYMEACHDSSKMTFPGNSVGLILDRGSWYFNRNGAITLEGPVLVDSSPEYPFAFYIGNVNYVGHTMTITGPVTGDDDGAVVFGPNPFRNSQCARKTTFQVENINGYAGSLAVTSAYDNVDADFGTCLTLISSTSACHIAVWRGGVLSTVGTDTRTRVGSITFHRGSRFQVNADPASFAVGTIHATGKITVENGPVELCIPAGFNGDDSHCYPVLAGAVDSPFTKDDFHFVNPSAENDPHSPLLRLEVAVDEETGLRTLYLVTYDVWQESFYTDEGHPHENRAGQGSSLTNALAWSDKHTPHPNASYKTSTYLRTLREPGTDYVFPGSALWLKSGNLRITTSSFSVPLFYSSVTSSVSTTAGNDGVVTVKSEKFHFMDGVLRLFAYKNQVLRLEGEIDGSAVIDMCGINTSSSAIVAGYELSGVNTNFQGAIKVRQELNKSYISYNMRHPTLIVNDGRNLGGKMTEFNPRALTMADLAFLSVTNSSANVVLADNLNRGVYVFERACFNITNGAVLDVRQPLLLSGKLWKDGEGTLVLGNVMSHEASDGGDVCDVPRIGSNLVEVVNGTVRIENADALSGSVTSWAKGTRLVVDTTNTENEDFRRYGLRNVGVDEPFVLLGGQSHLPISVAEPEDAIAPKVATNALFTVKSSAVESVMAMMPPLRDLRVWPTLPVKYVIAKDIEKGWTTVALESRNRGTIVSIR